MPASILEAGELFASRMRMSRALQQLWDVRESYIKFERGWEGFIGTQHEQNVNVKDWGLDHLETPFDLAQSQEAIVKDIAEQSDEEAQKSESKIGPNPDPVKETNDERVQARLDDIENLYVGPYLPWEPLMC